MVDKRYPNSSCADPDAYKNIISISEDIFKREKMLSFVSVSWFLLPPIPSRHVLRQTSSG